MLSQPEKPRKSKNRMEMKPGFEHVNSPHKKLASFGPWSCVPSRSVISSVQHWTLKSSKWKLETLIKSFKDAFAERFYFSAVPKRCVLFYLFLSLLARMLRQWDFHLCTSVSNFLALCHGKKNMKELCICRARKYCDVIQHNISLFKQYFPFSETANRMHIR